MGEQNTRDEPRIGRDQLAVLYSAEQLAERISELGTAITRDYVDKDLGILVVLKGSFIFAADLMRQIELDCTVDFLGVSSYGRSTKSSGVVKITHDLTHPIEGRDVLVVEDIIDTQLTMRYLLDNLSTRRPRSLRVCTLLYRQRPGDKPTVPIDYKGFDLEESHFVIGYGLDYGEIHRNLPYVGYRR